MATLSTTYLGLELKNPIIIGSSGLTNSVEKCLELEQAGAGAVVIKSIFEEEIAAEHSHILTEMAKQGYNVDNYEYFDYEIRAQNLEKYTRLIADTKKALSIPVIASVNCAYSHEWTSFAKEFAVAGADALELNMYILAADLERTSEDIEQAYFTVVGKVLAQVDIPVSLKLSSSFTSLGRTLLALSRTGVKGLTLFNRFYSPDFNIDKLEVIGSHMLSTPAEIATSLRWVSLMAQKLECDIAASTGVHDGTAVIKQLLAGATVVQLVSAIYEHGNDHIGKVLEELESWMDARGYADLAAFRGKMSQDKSTTPAVYERVQFMKQFGK